MKISTNPATAVPNGAAGSFARVFAPVQGQLDEVDRRISAQTRAFDPALEGYVTYAIGGGGKRLRPILVIAAAVAIGRRTRTPILDLALPTACAVEYIHTYSLIHDDLPAMDNDSLRRGRPTLHTIYGDGMQIRDWLYVEDHCRALELVLRAGTPGDCYTVGGGNALTNLQVLEAVCSGVDGLVQSVESFRRRYPACPAASGVPTSTLKKFVDDRLGHDRQMLRE